MPDHPPRGARFPQAAASPGRCLSATAVAALIALAGPPLAALAQGPPASSAQAPQHASSADTGSHRAGESYSDCSTDVCPEMVWVAPGQFRMGSPPAEQGRTDDEGPVHTVRIAYTFAAGRHPMTRGQWRAFVADTGHAAAPGCSWQDPGFPQDDRHPVVCVSWNDAQAYTAWLSHRTGHHYRLLTEAEYEYLGRAGSHSAYFWGRTVQGHCRYANADGRAGFAYAPSAAAYEGWAADDCRDVYEYTAPVDSFEPNAFGLHDTAGNVRSWVQDCYHDSYRGAPTDGSAWTRGDCHARVVRGGSWNALPPALRVADRGAQDAAAASDDVGLRVAMTD